MIYVGVALVIMVLILCVMSEGIRSATIMSIGVAIILFLAILNSCGATDLDLLPT
jgi:hypothetical protein